MIEAYEKFVAEKMKLTLGWGNIPRYMRDGIAAHIMQGRRTGDFLYNVFINDLQGAVGHADDTNRQLLSDYIHFMYMYFPHGSYGSPEAVASWRKSGGIIGQAAASQPETRTGPRDTDASGNCSKCGGIHIGSYYCPMPQTEGAFGDTGPHNDDA